MKSKIIQMAMTCCLLFNRGFETIFCRIEVARVVNKMPSTYQEFMKIRVPQIKKSNAGIKQTEAFQKAAAEWSARKSKK